MKDIKIIIVAAGKGCRFGSDCPKQYCLMGGRPVLMTTIDSFRKALPEAEIVVVISPEMQSLWDTLCGDFAFNSPRTVYGGATRWESVKNGLMCFEATNPDDVVLVHDAARPIVPAEMIRRVVDAAKKHDGAIPVVPVTDSLRMTTEEGSVSVDRSLYKAVQTPQGFQYWKLLKAYGQPYSPVFTDDASVMEKAGFGDMALVEGDLRTMKITNPNDIKIAEMML